MKSAQSLPPHVVVEFRGGTDFGTWTLGGQWRTDAFDSLQKGASALWHNSGGTGIFPNQTVDPDYISGGTKDQDIAESPLIDLTPFTDPTGAGLHENYWTVYFRLWYRPNHVVPSIGGEDQQHERLALWLRTGSDLLEIGAFDDFTLAESSEAQARELSRVGGDGGDARIGADGKWWYEQILAPKEAHQALLLGNSVEAQLIVDVNERDASDFGIGVERLTAEIVRGNVNDVAAARGGFGGIPADATIFPIELYRSILNSRRWI